MRKRTQAAFTLVEIMIALGLAAVVSTGLLLLTRAQLQAYQQNDQITRAQQNARAGMNYVENLMRRACGGTSHGQIRIFLPGVAVSTQPCVRLWDGATVVATNASFTGGAPTTLPDAIELIYGFGSLTTNSAAFAVGTPSVTVPETAGFVVGDFVLVTNAAMEHGALFRLSGIVASAVGTPGTLTFGSPAGAVDVLPTDTATTPLAGFAAGQLRILRARSIALYVNPDSTSPNFRSLMLDPDGMAGTTHADAEPVVEQLSDFQVAIGVDVDGNGLITDVASNTDEWLGNHSGDAALGAPTWNTAGRPQPRQLRAGMLVRTSGLFAGGGTTELALENRPAPVTGAGGQNPRWRPLQMVVAPRAWNLAE